MYNRIDYDGMTFDEFLARSPGSQKIVRHRFSKDKIAALRKECFDIMQKLDMPTQFDIARKYNNGCITLTGYPANMNFDSIQLLELLEMPKARALYYIGYFLSEPRAHELAQELKNDYKSKELIPIDKVRDYEDYYEALTGWSLF